MSLDDDSRESETSSSSQSRGKYTMANSNVCRYHVITSVNLSYLERKKANLVRNYPIGK